MYPYEILHESSLGTRCQSEELESYSKPSLENTQQLPVTVITAPSFMVIHFCVMDMLLVHKKTNCIS